MHIGIFGLSGSGKTTLAKEIANRNPNFSAISASRLIATFGGVVDYKSLDHDSIDDNQYALVRAYSRYKLEHPCTLIELHCLIEIETGFEKIDVEILRSLELDKVFFIKVPASEILRRRLADSTKERRITNVSELKILQNLSLEILKEAFLNRFEVLNSHNAVKIVDDYIHTPL